MRSAEFGGAVAVGIEAASGSSGARTALALRVLSCGYSRHSSCPSIRALARESGVHAAFLCTLRGAAGIARRRCAESWRGRAVAPATRPNHHRAAFEEVPVGARRRARRPRHSVSAIEKHIARSIAVIADERHAR